MRLGNLVRIHSGYFTGKTGKIVKLVSFRRKNYAQIETNCPYKLKLVIELANLERISK